MQLGGDQNFDFDFNELPKAVVGRSIKDKGTGLMCQVSGELLGPQNLRGS